MFEDMTFESILQRMLDRIPTNIDKREGSVIWDALAPAAAEMNLLYLAIRSVLDETFADTQSRDFLIRRATERGIKPYPATPAILNGVFTPANIDLAGQRFNAPNREINYVVRRMISAGIYEVESETSGAVGNQYLGIITPIDYINGLETAELTEILIPGEDEEQTEDLRRRYFDSLDAQAFGGNIRDYVDKVMGLQGIGGVKVYPVWDGGGTVKLVIIDAQFQKPSEALIEYVQKEIDPEQDSSKTGVGLAPIGHVVTVFGVEEQVVDITTHVTFQNGWEWDDVLSAVIETVDKYFTELAVGWMHEDNIIVSISQIETRLLNVAGILDIQDTLLNGWAQNLIIEPDNIPIRGAIENV